MTQDWSDKQREQSRCLLLRPVAAPGLLFPDVHVHPGRGSQRTLVTCSHACHTGHQDRRRESEGMVAKNNKGKQSECWWSATASSQMVGTPVQHLSLVAMPVLHLSLRHQKSRGYRLTRRGERRLPTRTTPSLPPSVSLSLSHTRQQSGSKGESSRPCRAHRRPAPAVQLLHRLSSRCPHDTPRTPLPPSPGQLLWVPGAR